MSGEHTQEPSAQTTPPMIQSPNFRIIYANGFSYRASVADFALTALVQIPVPRQTPEGNIIFVNANLQEVMIMLSLPSLKALAENLILMVREIEKDTGHIKVQRGSKLDADNLKIVSEGLKSSPLED